MKKVFSRLICIGALLVALMVPASVQASTSKQKALQAYNALLTNPTITWRDANGRSLSCCYKMTTSSVKFMTADLDGDSVPELLLFRTKAAKDAHGHKEANVPHFMLFTYKNSRVQYVCSFPGEIGVFPTFVYYPGTGIFETTPTMYRCEHYKYRNGHAWKWLKEEIHPEEHKSWYFIVKDNKPKRITFRCYKKQLKKYTMGRGVVVKACCTNTAANRARILK